MSSVGILALAVGIAAVLTLVFRDGSWKSLGVTKNSRLALRGIASDSRRRFSGNSQVRPSTEELSFEQAELGELLRQKSVSMADSLRLVGSALQLDTPPEPLPVLIDWSEMQGVIGHIISISQSLMEPGSTLRVLARIDGTHAVVNFMDTPRDSESPRVGKWFNEAHRRSVVRDSIDLEELARMAKCEHIVSAHQGRLYAAPSPLGSLGITLRLPLSPFRQRAREEESLA